MATLDDVLRRNAQRLKIKPVVLRGTRWQVQTPEGGRDSLL